MSRFCGVWATKDSQQISWLYVCVCLYVEKQARITLWAKITKPSSQTKGTSAESFDFLSVSRQCVRFLYKISSLVAIFSVLRGRRFLLNWLKWLSFRRWGSWRPFPSRHRKNCECCPGHSLIVNHYSSMSWFKFRNLSEMVNCVTNSLNHS